MVESGSSSWSLTCRSRAATQRLARDLGATLPPGTVLALVGDLGAGKTTFVQGLAEGLGVADPRQVTSPTYTLVNEYLGGRLPLLHLDFYRLDDASGAIALGLDEQVSRPDALVAVEWADKLPELIPPAAVWMRFSGVAGRLRVIEVTGLARTSRRGRTRR